MTVQAVLLVTAVVWAVSLIRSVRMRALVYSLPLPMTLALVSTGHQVQGAQLLGVLGLNLFFVVVAVTHHRLRWPILIADAAGIIGYVALSAGLLAVPVPFWPALAGTVALWVVTMLLLRRQHPATTTPQTIVPPPPPIVPPPTVPPPTVQPPTVPPPIVPPPTVPQAGAVASSAVPWMGAVPQVGAVPPVGAVLPAGAVPSAGAVLPARAVPSMGAGATVVAGTRTRLPAAVKLLVILVGATLTGLLGELLRAMVVTFPYSGVLVAIEGRRDLVAFTRHFARNSLALVGFLAAYHVWQDTSTAAALAAGWVAFAALAVALHAVGRGRRWG
ncbi:hypothetical protein ACGFH8_03430 [Micromonospora sp. NPDC049175]|uniref:hypothetical protein n=1 Tax=Micromonospora sp. NPDC049175 TaxID=3364266 RepID=UPI00371F3FF5